MERLTSNKKLIFAGIIAALCLAVVAAFASLEINNADAEESPVAPVVVNGFSAFVEAVDAAGNPVSVTLEKSDVQATNVPAGVTALANFKASNPSVAKLTFKVAYENAAAVAGQAVTLYVQHDNGQFEEVKATFDNAGYASFIVNGCSIFSVVTTLNQNTSNTAPKTGIYS